MNDENEENEALEGPVIFTIPASLTVPGFGFLIALNPDWGFTSQERNANQSSSVSSRFFGRGRQATTTHQRPSEYLRTNGTLADKVRPGKA
jgi:hypothetical protein